MQARPGEMEVNGEMMMELDNLMKVLPTAGRGVPHSKAEEHWQALDQGAHHQEEPSRPQPSRRNTGEDC